VLGIDRAQWPRYKSCGGAVSGTGFGALGNQYEEVVETDLRTVRVSYGTDYDRQLSLTPGVVIARMVMRDRFDQALLDSAIAAGADFSAPEAITALKGGRSYLEVETTGRKVRAAWVIGADGACSHVARLTGLRRSLPAALGLETEIQVPVQVLEQYEETAFVQYGIPDHGYGWVFPKEDHLSVGVGAFSPRSFKGLRKCLDELIWNLKLDPLHMTRPVGHFIPTVSEGFPLGKGRVLLAGDAACLADPLSGEGISPAILSGQITGELVAEALAGRQSPEQVQNRYSERIDKSIRSKLRIAASIAMIVYRSPQMFFNFLVTHESIADKYFQIVAGRLEYVDVLQELEQLLGSKLAERLNLKQKFADRL